ncbi:MAG: hypothetical protein Kow0059_11390 [Candidatus Sumerlaeia bacterium]
MKNQFGFNNLTPPVTDWYGATRRRIDAMLPGTPPEGVGAAERLSRLLNRRDPAG